MEFFFLLDQKFPIIHIFYIIFTILIIPSNNFWFYFLFYFQLLLLFFLFLLLLSLFFFNNFLLYLSSLLYMLIFNFKSSLNKKQKLLNVKICLSLLLICFTSRFLFHRIIKCVSLLGRILSIFIIRIKNNRFFSI